MERGAIDVQRLRELAWFGIPEKRRGLLWPVLLDVLSPLLSEHPQQIAQRRKTYVSALSIPISPLLSPETLSPPFTSLTRTNKQIEKDVKRINTLASGKDASETYVRAMGVFAKTRPVVGYVQGMCEIFKVFHDVLTETYPPDEAEALSYFCFSKLLVQVLDCFSTGQQGVERAIEEIEALLHVYASRLMLHFSGIGLEVKYFAYNWMSTFLFREFSAYKQVMDAHFSLGWGSFVPFNIAFSAALVFFLKDSLEEAGFEHALHTLQHVSERAWTPQELERLLAIAYVIFSKGQLPQSGGTLK
ncbi:hypothetical protein NEDG_01164 [Nematocida displodere]|uniref:Rab-GAP TBC domain-containing protein n=1 Tax=Nematocida displodere TaxID=1805483 RepID=A0A177EAS2_9MICR|nr:hypothetical protein NEDG_01164 [Nematocida displodere]